MARRYSMCLDINGFIRNNKFPEGWDIFSDENGNQLSVGAAYTKIHKHLAEGDKVIPLSNVCGNPCPRADKGCTGFDAKGGGCPGYEIEDF